MKQKLLFSILSLLFMSLFSGHAQSDCGTVFTDPAGPNANYANSSDYTVTFCPDVPGDLVTVTFTQFDTEATWDGLYVYNGNSITDTQISSANGAGNVPGGLPGSFWGTTIPGPFTSSDPSGCLTFRFRSDASINLPGWVANVTCAPPPTCPSPLTLFATNVTSNSATLSWSNPSSASLWHILALPCGAPAPTASTLGYVTSSANPHTLTGLSAATCYNVYIRNVCSDTDMSQWCIPITITTQDNPPVCGGNFVDAGGSNGNYPNWSNSVVTICPSVPGEVVTVTFTQFNTEVNFDGLYVFDGNSTAAPQIMSTNGPGFVPGGLPGSFWGNSIPGPFTSSAPDGCLTFHFLSDSSVTPSGWFANVTCGPPPTCPRPSALTPSDITMNSVTLNWNNNSSATTWNVLALPCGSPLPNSNATGWQVATTNPYVYSGLIPDTCYAFYVRGVCSDTDSSAWSVGYNVTTQQIPPACGGLFTDNGGSTQNYTNNADSIVTICPENLNGIVTVTFTQFDVQATSDGLYVFDGNSINAPQLASTNGPGTVPGGVAGAFWGTNIPAPFTSTSVDGCLTFRFRSDGFTTNAGWVANVSCGLAPDRLLLVAFVDSNGNGTREGNESYFPHGSYVTQMNNSGTDSFINASTGYHSIFDANPTNTYDISFQIHAEYASYYSVDSAVIEDLTIPLGSGTVVYFFPLTNIQTYSDVTVSIVPMSEPRPNQYFQNKIVYTNNGIAPASGTLTFTKDPIVTITSINQPGAINTPTGFTYDYINLQPFESRFINVYMTIPNLPIVSLGDVVTNSTSITAANDVSTQNNSFSVNQTIVAALDPNDKTEAHGPTILHELFTSDDYLYYTIRFENIGTAEARSVQIFDELDAQLDENTLTMVDASHSYVLSRTANVLTWTFENINLPVSVINTNIGKGHISFRIKPVPGYEVGDVIPNFASIFFESNPAIITNTFLTEFTAPLSTGTFNSELFSVHPNPSNGVVYVTVKSTERISNLTVVELLGKVIHSENNVNANQALLNLETLSKGMYLLEIATESGSKATQKIIID